MIKLENRVYLAGMVLFGLCVLGVMVWFGVSYHNWKARRAISYGCGSKGSKPLPSGLQRYHGGMDGYAMYLDLEMDPYTKTTGLSQTGTISVCFCGLQTTKCNSSTPCSAYQAKHLPVTYSLDTCILEIPLSNTCLQTTFSSAFSSMATLQGILYDAPKNIFHIQALGLKVMTENVVLAPVDSTKVWPCASCTAKDIGARIGSFLDFLTLEILAVHVYGKELYGIPDGWNDVSRGQVIQTSNPVIFDPSFYSLLRKPEHLIQIMKKGFESGRLYGGYPKTKIQENQSDEVLWSIFGAKALKDHLAAQHHLRAGDRTWVLGLTALRHGRWTMVPRLLKETLFASSSSDNCFDTPPRLAPHVGKDALRVRGLTLGTPLHIQLYLAFILDAKSLISYFPKAAEGPEILDEAMEFILTSHPCRAWGTKALNALWTINGLQSIPPSPPSTSTANPQTIKRLARWFSGFSLDERLAVFLASIPRSGHPFPSASYTGLLEFWLSFASFLNEDQVAVAYPDLLFVLGKCYSLGTPLKEIWPNTV